MQQSIITISVPYAWYIWRALSLAIWEETGIGGHLVWRISQ